MLLHPGGVVVILVVASRNGNRVKLRLRLDLGNHTSLCRMKTEP